MRHADGLGERSRPLPSAKARIGPITFSALRGQSFVLGIETDGSNLGYLAVFAAIVLAIEYCVVSRWRTVG